MWGDITEEEYKNGGGDDTSLQWKDHDHGPAVAEPRPALAQAILGLAGILSAILAVRFLLAIVGANPANTFAHLIYNVSYPLVSPFFDLLSKTYHYGVPAFEGSTLLAIAIYTFLAWGIARLLTAAFRGYQTSL